MMAGEPTPLSAKSQESQQTQRRNERRNERKRMAAQKRREQAAAARAAAEARAEQLAPHIQRVIIYARDGVTVLRGPRVEQQGVSMVRSNPVKRLAARSRNKEFATVTEAHVVAAGRLLVDWEEGGGGISFGCANYTERTSNTAQPGRISDAVIASISQQTTARHEVARVQEELGALWPVIHAVVICNIDPYAWGEPQGFNAHVSIGYTVAALDMLVRCYQPREVYRPQRIRAIEFLEPSSV